MGLLPLSSDPSFYHPLYGGPNYGYNGLPGGGFASSLAQSMLGGFMQSIGYAPLGVSQQNVYDRMNSIRLTQMHDTLMTDLASEATGNIANVISGAWSTVGAFDDDPIKRANQEKAIQAMAGTMAKAVPILQQTIGQVSPRAMDSMGLGLGPLVENMFSAGRMRIDPITGRMGLSGASSEALTRSVYQAGVDREGMPLSIRGELAYGLQRLGMMPYSGGDDALRSAGRDLGINVGAGPLSSEDRTRLMENPGVQTAIRTLDAANVNRTLKDYEGAISAMREIFGDAGHPDAPVAELLNALNALTSGGISQYSPGRLEQMVRTTQNLAASGGISIQGAMMLQQVATQQAMSLGMSPVMAIGSTQHALAFGNAFTGLGQGAYPMWGLSGVDDLRLKDMQLTSSAQSSTMANQLGAAMRINQIGGVRKGSDAAQMIASIKAGRAGNIEEEDFVRIMAEGTGMSESQVYRFLEQRNANAEFVDSQGLGTQVRRMQRNEMIGTIGEGLGFNTAEALQGLGITGKGGTQLARQLAQGAAQGIFGMSAADRADPTKRSAAIGASLTRSLDAAIAGGGPQAAAARQLKNQIQQDPSLLGTLSEELWGAADVITRDPAFQWGPQSIADATTMMDENTLRQTERNIAAEQGKSMLQSALAPLGKGNIAERALRQLINTDQSDPDALSKILAAAMGAEDKDKIMAAMQDSGVMEKLKAAQEAAGAYAESGGMSGGEALQGAAAGFGDAISKFLEGAKANGLDLRTEGTKKKLREALASMKGMEGMSEAEAIEMAGGKENYEALLDQMAGIAAAGREASGTIDVGEGDIDFSQLSKEEQAKLLQNQSKAQQKVIIHMEVAELTIKEDGATVQGDGTEEGRQ